MTGPLIDIPADAKPEDRITMAKLNNEFHKENFWRAIDAWLLGLTVLLVIATLFILGASGNDKLITWVEKYHYPLITLLLGYILGKTGKATSKTT